MPAISLSMRFSMTRRNLEASGVAEPEGQAAQLAMAAGKPEAIAVAAFPMLPSCYRY
jgi:hypothetical protein